LLFQRVLAVLITALAKQAQIFIFATSLFIFLFTKISMSLLEGDLDTSVVPHGITEELTQSYIDYAMSVIVSRALPDTRD